MLLDPHREPSSPELEAALYENARLRAERNSLRDILGGTLKDRHQISVLGQRVIAQARRLRCLYDLIDDLVEQLRWQRSTTQWLEALSQDLQRQLRKEFP